MPILVSSPANLIPPGRVPWAPHFPTCSTRALQDRRQIPKGPPLGGPFGATRYLLPACRDSYIQLITLRLRQIYLTSCRSPKSSHSVNEVIHLIGVEGRASSLNSV